MSVLIIGGDSLIGFSLGRKLEESGQSVVSTTRRRATSREQRLFLDLANLDGFSLPDFEIDAAVFCAASTRVKWCDEHPRRTRQINVESQQELARQLVERFDSRLVFLSSNLVFDGSVSRVPHDAPRSPCNEYGRQKVEMETWLAEEYPENSCIVRLTKVIDSDMEILRRWKGAMESSQAIEAFSDMYFAPVGLDRVSDALCRVVLAGESVPPLLQISPTREISYLRFAEILVEGCPVEVLEKSAKSVLGPDALVPRYASLDSTTWENFCGEQAFDPEEEVRRVLQPEFVT